MAASTDDFDWQALVVDDVGAKLEEKEISAIKRMELAQLKNYLAQRKVVWSDAWLSAAASTPRLSQKQWLRQHAIEHASQREGAQREASSPLVAPLRSPALPLVVVAQPAPPLAPPALLVAPLRSPALPLVVAQPAPPLAPPALLVPPLASGGEHPASHPPSIPPSPPVFETFLFVRRFVPATVVRRGLLVVVIPGFLYALLAPVLHQGASMTTVVVAGFGSPAIALAVLAEADAARVRRCTLHLIFAVIVIQPLTDLYTCAVRLYGMGGIDDLARTMGHIGGSVAMTGTFSFLLDASDDERFGRTAWNAIRRAAFVAVMVFASTNLLLYAAT